MRTLFRSFERERLEYLLISGQAAVLYGAATFTQDIDLWVRPTAENAGRLLRALARWLDREIRGHRSADVACWAPIIEELRRPRTSGALLEKGRLVASLLR